MPRIIIDRKAEGLEDASLSCPANAFRKSNDGEFVICPDDCIDCGVCQSMVADGVILDDSEATEADAKFNEEKSKEWNNVQ